jgi:hypothetical protein
VANADLFTAGDDNDVESLRSNFEHRAVYLYTLLGRATAEVAQPALHTAVRP